MAAAAGRRATRADARQPVIGRAPDEETFRLRLVVGDGTRAYRVRAHQRFFAACDNPPRRLPDQSRWADAAEQRIRSDAQLVPKIAAANEDVAEYQQNRDRQERRIKRTPGADLGAAMCEHLLNAGCVSSLGPGGEIAQQGSISGP